MGTAVTVPCCISGKFSGPGTYYPINDYYSMQKATEMKDRFLQKLGSSVGRVKNVGISVLRYPHTYTISADVKVRIGSKIYSMKVFWDMRETKVVFAKDEDEIIDEGIQITPAGETPVEWAETFFKLFCRFIVYLEKSLWTQHKDASRAVKELNVD